MKGKRNNVFVFGVFLLSCNLNGTSVESRSVSHDSGVISQDNALTLSEGSTSSQIREKDSSYKVSDDSKNIPEKTDITNLNAKSLNSQQISLKEAYKNYFPIGAAVDQGKFIDDSKYSAFVVNEYSSITPANQLKPTRIQPSEGNFNFGEADKFIAFAMKNKMKVRGHVLIPQASMPVWFFKSGSKEASKELILARMKTHISTVMGRYKGKIYCWDVVNEAIANTNSYFKDSDKLYKIVGEEYFEKAFLIARESDPNAKLFYNDNGFGSKAKRIAVYNFLKKMKAKGVPIDGIGIQGHVRYDDGFDDEALQECIDLYSSLGLEIQITELDVSIFGKGIYTNNIDKIPLAKTTYNNDVLRKQGEKFRMFFEVCRKNKGKVTGITMWAPADWDNSLTKAYKRKNYPYLFDRELSPKPFLKEILDF